MGMDSLNRWLNCPLTTLPPKKGREGGKETGNLGVLDRQRLKTPKFPRASPSHGWGKGPGDGVSALELLMDGSFCHPSGEERVELYLLQPVKLLLDPPDGLAQGFGIKCQPRSGRGIQLR